MIIRDIIDRLKVATGPDREIDGRIWAELDDRDINGPVNSSVWYNAFFGRSRRPPNDNCYVFTPVTPGRARPAIAPEFVPRYTGDLETVIRLLIEPSDSWQVCNGDDGLFYSFVGKVRYQRGATPALSLCIAALKNRIGDEE